MSEKINRYYNYIVGELMKHTYLNVTDGVIGYLGNEGRGYMLLGDIDYDIGVVAPYMEIRYGTRNDDDEKEIIKRYKLKIMEKLWGFKL